MSLVEGLVRHYDDFNLDVSHWEIPDQGVTALWGPSGSGKTTVFRILLGLEACPTLKWTFDGEDLAKLPVPERRLGVVFQTLELFPHMTAEENILFAARARSLPADETKSRLALLTKDLSMESYLKRKVSILSGGEAQRVAIARALIAKPRMLFLDEPFSSLDAQLKEEAREVVKRTIEDFKVPTLLVTHDKRDLEVLATSVTRIKNGRLI